MKTVQILLGQKGHEVYSIEPSASVFDAITMMADKEIGALLVMEGDRIAGIMSERDYARKVILANRSSKDTRVADIMTSKVIYAGPAQPIDECMAMMTGKRIRHLPVLDNGNLIGMLSIGDLVKAIIDEQGFHIEQLVRYIVGDRPV